MIDFWASELTNKSQASYQSFINVAKWYESSSEYEAFPLHLGFQDRVEKWASAFKRNV